MTSVQTRTYTGASDLKRLQDFNAAAIAVTDHCGYLHPGDIPHHLFSGNKYYDPTEILTIWEDDRGVAAWLLVGPRHKLLYNRARNTVLLFDLELDPHESTNLAPHDPERTAALLEQLRTVVEAR